MAIATFTALTLLFNGFGLSLSNEGVSNVLSIVFVIMWAFAFDIGVVYGIWRLKEK